MFERDYLMRMFMQMGRVIYRSLFGHYPDTRQEAQELEDAIGETVGIDPDLLFNLEPESMVTMLQLGNFNAEIGGYVVRTMYYEAAVLERNGFKERADLRIAQADAIVKAYDLDITVEDATEEQIREFFADTMGGSDSND